jgi:chemotaxis protein CheY-P-specific phosphatase CheC
MDAKSLWIQQPLQQIFGPLMPLAFRCGATSLAAFLNTPITLSRIKSPHELSQYPVIADHSYRYCNITMLHGALEGSCYWYISDDVMQQLGSISPFDSNKSMLEAMILEADNILAAAILSAIAEVLGIPLYGGPPQYSFPVTQPDFLQYNNSDYIAIVNLHLADTPHLIQPLLWHIPDSTYNRSNLMEYCHQFSADILSDKVSQYEEKVKKRLALP